MLLDCGMVAVDDYIVFNIVLQVEAVLLNCSVFTDILKTKLYTESNRREHSVIYKI